MSTAEHAGSVDETPDRTQRLTRGTAARPRRVSTRFLRSELRLVAGRRRNIAGLGVLAAVPVLLAVVVRVQSNGSGSGSGGPAFIGSITQNGLFVALASLAVEMPLFLPLAVAAISADSVAGEANLGTLRYLLVVPVSRTRLLAVKYVATVLSALLGVLVVAVVGAGLGLALFGGGPVVLLSGTEVSLGQGFGRLLLVCLYLTACLAALAAIGLFVSTLTEQPIGATITVVLVTLVSQVLDAIPQVAAIHPYLLTHWWLAFGDLLRDPVATDGVGRGLLSAAAYAAVFVTAAWARFGSRDVTA